jgi:hypothetical protein
MAEDQLTNLSPDELLIIVSEELDNRAYEKFCNGEFNGDSLILMNNLHSEWCILTQKLLELIK